MKYNFKALSTFVILVSAAFLYQNCSDVKLAPVIPPEKLSCDPSIYNIAGQFTEGNAVYFIQANNYDITQEYSGSIKWFIDGVLQDENIVHHNRLHLSCDSQPEAESIKAQFITDCGTEIEIFGSTEYLKANICEEEPVPEPPEAGPPIDPDNYCESYKESLKTMPGAEGYATEYDRFMAYKAESRGYTAKEMTFEEKTGRVLGTFKGYVCSIVLPGRLEKKEYLALSYRLPVKSESNMGEFTLWFSNQTGTDIQEHDIAATISPCKGDFRPRLDSKEPNREHYSEGWCRRAYGRTGSGVTGRSDLSKAGCYSPPGVKMYMNVSLGNMFVPPPYQPELYNHCFEDTYCGAGTHSKLDILPTPNNPSCNLFGPWHYP